jgi:hypothetical protein
MRLIGINEWNRPTTNYRPFPIRRDGAGLENALGSALLLDDGAAYYAYAYYDQIQQVTDSRRVGNELLAAVFVHEIGHVLLHTNSHSPIGIMNARWTGDELRQVSEGALSLLRPVCTDAGQTQPATA